MKAQTKWFLLCTGLLLAAEAQTSIAVTCNAMELSPCASAIMSSTTSPTTRCCNKIKEQQPCLCQYLKNPNLQKFVNSPNARKVAATCGTPFPKC